MGFDLYGRNPHNPSGHVRPNIDWTDSSITEDDKKEYFDAVDKYESRVKGDYFRANVWWWRPIWNFVTNYCDDILSDKDIEKGSFNDGHFINKAKRVHVSVVFQDFSMHFQNSPAFMLIFLLELSLGIFIGWANRHVK